MHGEEKKSELTRRRDWGEADDPRRRVGVRR